MKTVDINSSVRESNSSRDDRAWASVRVSAPDRQRQGPQFPLPVKAHGPDHEEDGLSARELEFMQAIRAYKQSSGRLFPTWSEVLEVLRSLGYRKPPPGADRETGGALFESRRRSADFDRFPADDANIDDAIEGWVRALSRRDRDTEEHTRRVADVTVTLARAMHVGPAGLIQIRRGALLHDIGKMGIPDAILHKPGPLCEAEWNVMRRHPVYAYEWLAPIRALWSALDVPYCHHEWWDGNGYPRGLAGDAIPLAARIFAVVDVWDALGSDRPYRRAWPAEDAEEHIRALAGTHLDPEVVDTFLGMMRGDATTFNLAPNAGHRALARTERTWLVRQSRRYHARIAGQGRIQTRTRGPANWEIRLDRNSRHDASSFTRLGRLCH